MTDVIRHEEADLTPLRGLNILLIDDCQDNQFLFKRLLVRKGATVSLASDGREGLEQISSADFDSVLLDIQMPVMDGFETMEALNKLGYRTPVIALTGYNRESEKENIMLAGFSSIVSKPLDATQLVKTILESITQ